MIIHITKASDEPKKRVDSLMQTGFREMKIGGMDISNMEESGMA